MSIPAQKIIVHNILDWNKIEKNLMQYPIISKYYSITDLKDFCGPPFYCHIIAWFLNCQTMSFLNNFDGLLARTEARSGASWMQKWKDPNEGKNRCGFNNFYSLLWELQMADFFTSQGARIEWLTENNPDFKVNIEGQEFFVECYNYYKSFAVKLYIEEILLKLNPKICIEYSTCLKFSLPQNNETTSFLNEIFSLFLDDTFMRSKTEEAKRTSPVELYSKDNFKIVLFGEAEYLGRPNAQVDGENYLNVALKETVNNKKCRNNLPKRHPNLLATNFLLSLDYQIAISQQADLGKDILIPDDIVPLDGLLIAACGIDSCPGKAGFKYFFGIDNHPAKTLINKNTTSGNT